MNNHESQCTCKKITRGLLRWCACCISVGVCICIGCDNGGLAMAAPSTSTVEESASGTIQPPQLLQQVELSYPKSARSSGEHGDVVILVDVDATGKVLDARFESGPNVFRKASLATASRLKFSPATIDGVPVSATTRVSFHFAPPPDSNKPNIYPNAEMVVHSTNPDLEDTRARTTLDEVTLEQSAGDDLAETISKVAGVRMAGGKTDASKPIIRGQQERRLLVLNNGVRHESQKWGPDHATEIDPFSAGSISIIRGAAGARYGPDAIGGVILVEPPPMRDQPGVVGKVLTAYNTNGRRPYGALRLDAGFENGLSARIEGNAAMSASQSAPEYILGNTASRSWNLGGAVGYEWDTGSLRASWHHHDYRAGIFYGVNHHSTTDEFLGQLDADRPVTAHLWSSNYDIDRPYQDVTHDLATLQLRTTGEWGSMASTYAFQVNLRKEYEPVRGDNPLAQFDFTLRTHSIDTLYEHPTINTSIGTLNGGVGLQSSFQENVYKGLSLIPNYRSLSGGIFAYERLSMERLDIEAGARADALSRAAYIPKRDYQAHARRGTINEANCEAIPDKSRCPADYTAASFSVGTLVHVIPSRFDVKLDLSTASRFPNVDELYMLGWAPTFPVYANGNPNLGIETVWNASLTSGVRHETIEVEASVFGQFVNDYIYFSPEFTESGEPKFDINIRGAWPSWEFQPIDAMFYGLDGSINLAPLSPVGLEARGGLVRAEHVDTGHHLIGTPADHLNLALIGRPPSVGPIHKIELRVTTEMVASQSRVRTQDDFAPAPPGYTLWGAGIDAEIGHRKPIRVGIDARNLLDQSYRDYSSLLRYYANQPGRDIRFRMGMDF